MSSSSNSPNFEYFPTPRSREENQERAFIAASRRKDRSLDARLESAHRASTLHRQRTGKALNITKEIVENEEMYEEIDVRQQEREIRILQAQNEQGEDQFYSELLASLRLRPNNTDGARGRRHSSVTSRPSANPNGVRRPVSDLSGRRLHNSRPIPAAPVPSQMMSAPPIFESYSQEPQSQQAMPPLPSASPYFFFLDFYPSLPNMNIVPQAPLPSYDPPPQAVSPWPTPSVNNWPFLQENTNTAVAPPQEPYLNPADPMDFADELNFFNGVMAFNNEEDPEFDEFSEFATGLGTNVLPESAAVLWQTQ